jgi:hypothetical protein
MKREGKYVRKSSSIISYFGFSLAAILLESNSIGGRYRSPGQYLGIE